MRENWWSFGSSNFKLQMCMLNYTPHVVMFQLALEIPQLTNLQNKMIKKIENESKTKIGMLLNFIPIAV